jgi:Ca2+-binding RTX toxin-like protein
MADTTNPQDTTQDTTNAQDTTNPDDASGTDAGTAAGPIEGTDQGETIVGTAEDDVINALGGPDLVLGLAGSDQIDAGKGDDTVVGGDGDDTITGGAGNDTLAGDAGADTFVFDPSTKQGADTIADLNPDDGDKIAFSAAGLEQFGIDPNDFSAASLDESDDFQLAADKEGDVQIKYPGGTIALHGMAFTEGLTFAELGANDLFDVSRLITGTDQADTLTGTDGDDVIDAKGGDDSITPGSGDDIVTTGEGRDQVNIDPSNPTEGQDTITDFSAPSGLDPTAGDYLAFNLADIFAADPSLPAADGDASSLSLDDLDESGNWTLSAGNDGNLLFTHPGGSVEFSNVAFNDQHFADVGSSILVDGREFTTPIPVESATTNGEQTASTGGAQTTTSGDQATTSDQAVSGEEVTVSDGTTDGEQPVVDASQLDEGALA